MEVRYYYFMIITDLLKHQPHRVSNCVPRFLKPCLKLFETTATTNFKDDLNINVVTLISNAMLLGFNLRLLVFIVSFPLLLNTKTEVFVNIRFYSFRTSFTYRVIYMAILDKVFNILIPFPILIFLNYKIYK